MKFTSFVKSSALKGAGAAALTIALGAGLVGCGGGGIGGGAVAATVNGQDIMEQTVTDYIADFRESTSLETDEAWGEWMVANGYTPETVREEVIDYYINQDLYEQAASEYNVAVEDADVQSALEETKAMFESDEAFQQALEASNMTEESYIEDVIRPNLLQSKLAEAIADEEGDGTGDEALLAQAQAMADQMNGSKRSSHILLVAEDGEDDAALQARAQELLDQLNAGEISFEDAAAQYSTDSGSAANGGDVGWDALNTFVTEYQDAVDGLEVGQIVAAPVQSEYGYHIIKVTEEFDVPAEGITSLDQVPDDFLEYLSYMMQSNSSQNFSTWFQEYRDAATIEINPMPEGLPYDIDLAPYEEAAANAAAGDVNTDATSEPVGDDAAVDDAAAADAAADQAANDAEAAGNEADQAAADEAAGDQGAADAAADEAANDAAAAGAEGEQAANDEAAAEGAAQ